MKTYTVNTNEAYMAPLTSSNARAMRRIHKHDADVLTAAQGVSKFGQARLRAKKRHVKTAQCLHETPRKFHLAQSTGQEIANRRKDNNPIVIVLEAHKVVSS